MIIVMLCDALMALELVCIPTLEYDVIRKFVVISESQIETFLTIRQLHGHCHACVTLVNCRVNLPPSATEPPINTVTVFPNNQVNPDVISSKGYSVPSED